MALQQSSIEALIAHLPPWCTTEMSGRSFALVSAAPVRASNAVTSAFRLRIWDEDGLVLVKEQDENRLLPKFCPERHINEDGSFCIGIRAGEGITAATSVAWWQKLAVFLLCQETVRETGMWPSEVQLSHGDAGDLELQAEALADSLGRLSEYQTAVRRNSGPMFEYLAKVDPKNGRLVNGRASCLCGRTTRKHLLLRRDCHQLGCPIELEFARRAALKRFWKSLRGKPCCQTLGQCSLKEGTS